MTNPAPAVAAYVPFYASREPYITVDEFLAAPTGADVSQLVPGGTSSQNRAALSQLIDRASDYADSLCYQVLGATQDMQVGRYRITRDGTIRVPLDFTPVIQVSAVNLGYRADAMQPMTSLSGLWIQRKSVEIPIAGLVPGYGYAPSASARVGEVFAQVTYVNGYAVTTLALPAAAGATAVTPGSVLGLFPGMPLTVADADPSKTEKATVAPSYVVGGLSVPLVSPLSNAHAAGTSCSALPGAIKQAVISLTAHLIKTRGAEGMVLGSVSGGPADVEKIEPGGDEDYAKAVDLLHPFRRAQ